MEKNYRIHTNIINDTVLNVNLKQDFDNLEVLSLKLRQEDAYRLQSSNYGVIIGRVLANDAFGIPNAKVSVFIKKDKNEINEIASIYPYESIKSRDGYGRRYNLLPDSSDDSCYRVIGTFPQKRLILDENTELEVYEKYWKYTTVTNQAGDYMIFGVPTGAQQLKLDIDLSDIGILSQKPRDMEFKGYNINQFDSSTQFKESTNLDGLAQIISQESGVFVYPFWGDEDNGVVAITRYDFQVDYKFEPTCVFMGSIISDNYSNAIGHKCSPERFNGYADQLIAGEGTIEMIRKTIDGLTEEFQINGNQLINGDGVWCYQIPMNLDYIGTDEYGNIVPVDSPTKGIPTRTRVRFRISKQTSGDEGFSRHTAKYLVPNNIPFSKYVDEKGYGFKKPVIENGNDIDRYFEFGSSTPKECYRDLYWNKVYSVKNYIPRIQTAHRSTSKYYGGIRAINLEKNKLRLPYNKLRFDIPFTYFLLCSIFTLFVDIIVVINLIISTLNKILCPKILGVRPWCIKLVKCISLPVDFAGDENTIFYPACDCKNPASIPPNPKELPNAEVRCSRNVAVDIIQQKLAEDYDVVKMDFYDDWLNGALYMPLWMWRKRRKKSFLFGLIHIRAKSEYCTCDKSYSRFKKMFSCSLPYNVNETGILMTDWLGGSKYHNAKRYNRWIRPTQGIIREYLNKDNIEVYYYTPGTVRDLDNKAYINANDVPYIRMYATDIILLGSLNENDIDGIPQLFKYLPPTTENVPSIASVVSNGEEEPKNDLEGSNEEEDNNRPDTRDEIKKKENTIVVTTGMDWGNDGQNDSTIRYREGLFLDLACNFVRTKPKSCINVERICELGVNLDSTFKVQYGPSDGESGEIFPDGFITKHELEDLESRAMFATMNHIGFVPSDENQIDNHTTGYKSYKFAYMYPTDFDGRLWTSTATYVRSSFQQKTKDNPSLDYERFRFGDDDIEKWYFYFRGGNNTHFPVYNNSFYFYFGLNPGKTAIDVFNRLFYANCFKNEKYPFSMTVSSKANNTLICNDTNDMGYIMLEITNIVGPYKVQLFDYDGNEVGEIDNIDDNTKYVAFGGYPNNDGKISFSKTQIINRNIVDDSYSEKRIIGVNEIFKNGNYTVRVIDANGRYMEKKVELFQPSATLNYQVFDLSTKFFENEQGIPISKKIEICNEDAQNYGQIQITGVTIDNVQYNITNVEPASIPEHSFTKILPDEKRNETMPMTLTLKSETGEKTKKISVGIYVEPKYDGIDKCLCDNAELQPGNSKFYNGVWTLFVYRPTMYTFMFKEFEEGCRWEDTNKKTSNNNEHLNYTTIQVNNGKEFIMKVNTVPFKFLTGTRNEDFEGYRDKFYQKKSEQVNQWYKSMRPGWFESYNEKLYDYKGNGGIFELNYDSGENIEQWDTLIQFQNGHKVTYEDLRNVLRYKFSNLFNMSESIFMTDKSGQEIKIEMIGGSGITLERGLMPAYENFSDLDKIYLNEFIYSTTDKATNDGSHPTIVPAETALIPNGNGTYKRMYDDTNDVGPKYSTLFSNKKDDNYIYNYFAAFTKNGGIVINKKSCKTDTSIKYQSIPFSAATCAPPMKGGICTGGSNSVYHPTNAYNKVIKPTHTYNGITYASPYLAIPFIDRRFDYNFVVYTPNRNKIKEKDNLEWKGDFEGNQWMISGHTYNGIEMAYDDNHQIIGSNEYIKNVEPKRFGNVIKEKSSFEYSYDSEKIKDISGNVVDIKVSTSTKFNEKGDVIRMPYNMFINDNKGIKDGIIDDTKIYDESNLVSAYSEDDNEIIMNNPESWFKVHFRTKQVMTKGTYPLHKEIMFRASTDSLSGSSYNGVSFNYDSCSYAVEPKYDRSISAITTNINSGENVKFNIEGNNIISYTQNDKDYNFEYSVVQLSNDKKAVYAFVVNTNIAFNILIPKEDSHDIYVYLPNIVDARDSSYPLRKFKSETPEQINERRGKSVKERFSRNASYFDNNINMALCSYSGGDVYCYHPEGFFSDKLGEDSLLFADSNDMFLPASHPLFSRIVFSCNFNILGKDRKIPMFGTIPQNDMNNPPKYSILIRRSYRNNERKYLTRKIDAYTMTDPIKLGPIKIENTTNSDKYIGFKIDTMGCYDTNGAEYTLKASVKASEAGGTSSGETNNDDTVEINSIGYIDEQDKDKDEIRFDWDSITSGKLASSYVTLFIKLENSLIIKVVLNLSFDEKGKGLGFKK